MFCVDDRGTGDDNVHPKNTLQVVQAIIEKHRQVDLALYPNRNHRINGGNTSRHLFTLMTCYTEEYL